MTNLISNFSFTVNPEAAASFHHDGVVILHTGKGSLFTSNETGAGSSGDLRACLTPRGRRHCGQWLAPSSKITNCT